MLYMLLPHEQHSDDGLGAMGDEFEEAGNALELAPDKGTYFRITRCYLYRHAIELYLKSVVIILHRGLKIPYGKEPYHGAGYMKLNGRWHPLYRTHSLKDLWEYVREIIQASQNELEARCKTDWQDIPDELSEAIEKIDKLDRTSTFFRYPSPLEATAEITKSAWREVSMDSVDEALPTNKPIKMMLLSDPADNVKAAFQYHDETLAEILELLKKTANDLTGFHIGLRCELMDGR